MCKEVMMLLFLEDHSEPIIKTGKLVSYGIHYVPDKKSMELFINLVTFS